jgi:OOP family OmpA-OmpF porin
MKKVLVAFSLCGALLASDGIDVTLAVGGAIPEGNLDLENQLIGGLRLGKYFDNPIISKVEAGFDFTKTKYDEMGPGTRDRQALITRYFVNAIKEFDLSRSFKPYILGGIGWENIQRKARYGNNDAPFVDYGVGIRYLITDALSLRAEARGAVKLNSDRGDNNFFATLGISYEFGAKVREPKPEEPVRYVVPAGDSELEPKQEPQPAEPAMEAAPAQSEPAQEVAQPAPMSEAAPAPSEPAAQPEPAAAAPAPMSSNEVHDADSDGIPDDRDVCPGTTMGAHVDEMGCQRTVNLKVKFQFDKYDITDATKQKLAEVARILKNENNYRIVLTGYADSVGTPEYNMDLSFKRAATIAEELIKNGVDKSRINVDWFGEEHPAATNDTSEGRSENRRVEGALIR